MNRGWIDRSAKRLPTYHEITGSKGQDKKGKARADFSDADAEPPEAPYPASRSPDNAEDDVDDEEFDEIADRFESSYNFRFEEP